MKSKMQTATLKDLAPQHERTAKAQNTMTPEEEFRQKYPHVEVESEFFKLVGCMTPSTRSDKDELIDALEEKYL